MNKILEHFELNTGHGEPDMIDQLLIDSIPEALDIEFDGPTSLAITYENIRRSQMRNVQKCLDMGDQLQRLDHFVPHYLGYLQNKLSVQELKVLAHMAQFIKPVNATMLADISGIKKTSFSSILTRMIDKKVIVNTSKGLYEINNEDNNFLAFCIMRFHSGFPKLIRQVPEGNDAPIDYIIENGINLKRFLK